MSYSAAMKSLRMFSDMNVNCFEMVIVTNLLSAFVGDLIIFTPGLERCIEPSVAAIVSVKEKYFHDFIF